MPTKRSNKGQPVPQRPTGRLILSGLTAFGYHGNKTAERELGQVFTADLEVTIDTRQAAATDRIEDTISYPLLEKTARQILEGKPANLLETVAERIATALLKHPEVIQVTVRVSKRPPLPNLNAFTVEITRPAD
ncbi:MAG TPA: dihydroneopterin aldolase [Candidatus Binatus sp.]|nr:dihydroneopterin aldolase [Candidatus Binatus sp.]